MTEAQKLLAAKAVGQLNTECHTGDEENDHQRADEILCYLLSELGCGEVVDAWETVEKWYA